MSTYVVGVDVGGTKILAAVVDETGSILGQAKMPTKAKKNKDIVIDRIADCIQKAINDAGVPLEAIQAAGIGAPGTLDQDTGIVTLAPNLGWKDVPLKTELEDRISMPIFVENDVNLGTLGEHTFGAGQNVSNLVGIFIGTGIGGGIIMQGELFRGASKTAGEIGHIVVKVDGPKCGCGNRGCLEALASRTAMTKQIQNAILKKKKKSILLKLTDGDLELIRSGVLAEAIRRKDKLTRKVLKNAIKYIGAGIGTIVNFLNPEMIVLGGGVVEALDETFLDEIQNAAAKHTLPNTLDAVQIVQAQLGDDAGILGAAALARQQIKAT